MTNAESNAVPIAANAMARIFDEPDTGGCTAAIVTSRRDMVAGASEAGKANRACVAIFTEGDFDSELPSA